MASPAIFAFLSTFLVLQSLTAADFLSPLLSPFLDDVCKEVECGKGKCKSSLDNNLPFICECEPGWKQITPFEQDHDLLHFLPCVIPNCTVDISCNTAAEPPMPEFKEPPLNESFFDVCYWLYCGGGACIPSMEFCAFGMDCARLGITVSNESTTSTPKLEDPSENHGNYHNSTWEVPLVDDLDDIPSSGSLEIER
ncbi:hypothetical protein BVC80_441g161 [Macleaya cordata]|uniref:Uncharacterized protein n=1 Tax=Macleaya cordata TaxID=56857 RepID=A0A200Q4J6_MACCD|nr:hypothetical protein BVC80_441g161 [Macleaya cordata]